jgi:signal peptidase II
MNPLSKLLSTLIILGAFVFDRISKEWIMKKLFYGESMKIFPFFHLTYIENTGMAFGFGQNRNIYFIIISILLIILLLVFHHKTKDQQDILLRCSLALIIGGALGNLYDRITYGNVIDFLDFFIGTTHWPAFNVADSCICIGSFLFLFTHYKQKSIPPVAS